MHVAPVPVSVRLLDRLAVAGYASRDGRTDVLRLALRSMADDELALFETLIDEATAAGGPGGSPPAPSLGSTPPPARRLLEPLAWASRDPDHFGELARAVLLARLKGADEEAFAEAVSAVTAEKERRA